MLLAIKHSTHFPEGGKKRGLQQPTYHLKIFICYLFSFEVVYHCKLSSSVSLLKDTHLTQQGHPTRVLIPGYHLQYQARQGSNLLDHSIINLKVQGPSRIRVLLPQPEFSPAVYQNLTPKDPCSVSAIICPHGEEKKKGLP